VTADPRTEGVGGTVEPEFEGVLDAFAANFDERGEVGAACCVYVDGRPVADLWGGVADATTGRAWEEETIALVFSCTKGVTATCANLLIERGQLDPDAPVARYWPEFAQQGKDAITVRQVLSHQAGLAVIEGDLTLEEALSWDPVVDALARQAPNWEPGTAHGYHLRAYGWLVGELVRRVTGRTIGAFFRDEIAAPLRLDFWIGLPEAEEARVARLVPPDADLHAFFAGLGDDVLLGRATTGPSGHFAYDDMWNRRELHACELPSSNGIGDARSLARLYASLLGEVAPVGRHGVASGADTVRARTLQPDTVSRATQVQVRGPDKVILTETAFGLGYMLPPSLNARARPAAFGHAGAGGSLAFADPDAGFAFAYVMNDLRFDLRGDPRSETLVEATYQAVRALT
jgi:CubicO group peptidase (beta-lactamase class C family)